MAGEFDASVIVPTRSRLPSLRRCLEALASQETPRRFEIIVVDDDDSAPTAVLPARPSDDPPLRVVRTFGRGPAAARNAGIEIARAPSIVFTDDDTIPSPRWLEAACSSLERNPDWVGVEGVTVSLPYDYLYEHSIESELPGRYLTCNIAYRARILAELGGFDETFPAAYCEDLDLAFRTLRVGPIGFAPEMRVLHTPRHISLRELIGRGTLASSEIYLLHQHPDRWRWRLPVELAPTLIAGKRWLHWLASDGTRLVREPDRGARFVAAAAGQLLLMAVSGLRAALWERSSPASAHRRAE